MRSPIVYLITFSLALAGCGKSGEADIEKQNAKLTQEMAAKDRFIEEVTSTINQVHDRLEATWAMQKKVMRQSSSIEGGKNVSQAELKQQMLDRISDISSMLSENRKRVTDLQQRLKVATIQYVGLEQMVDQLKKAIDEREKSIADLQTRVHNLEGDVNQKTQIIAARDETIHTQSQQIEDQEKELNAGLYIVGKRSELKDKGVIMRKGGILWGLLGSTTVLAGSFDEDGFTALDKTKEQSIDVPGEIDELVPLRDKSCYSTEERPDHHTVLRVIKPENFWRERHLVIVTD